MSRIITSTNVKAALEASRNLPAPYDQVDVAMRASPYGELYTMPVLPEAQVAADEGSYWTVTNPAPGTGIATITALTTLVDTSPFILFKNGWSQTDNNRKRIVAKWLRLTCTAPGTSSTSLRFAIKLDTAGARYTSGATVIAGNSTIGTATNQPINPNGDIGTASSLQFYAGAVVAAAATSPRLIDSITARITIPVVGDSYLIFFGENESFASGSLPATVSQMAFPMAPWIIGPQGWGAFHLWSAGQAAAASYEFTFAYVER